VAAGMVADADGRARSSRRRAVPPEVAGQEGFGVALPAAGARGGGRARAPGGRRGAPAPPPRIFQIFSGRAPARAARARRPPGAGAFSSHRFRTRGSAFLISRYSYLLIEASEFFLKVTNLHEIILIFIKL
jgi:hypothetical protein